MRSLTCGTLIENGSTADAEAGFRGLYPILPAKSMLCRMLSLRSFSLQVLPWYRRPCSFLFKITLTTLGLLCFPVTFRVIFPGVMGNVTGSQKVGSTWSPEWFASNKLIPHDLLLNEANEHQINVTEFRTHYIRSSITVDCKRGCNRRAFCLPCHKMFSSSEYQGKKCIVFLQP